MGIYILLAIMPLVISWFNKGDINKENKRAYCIICGTILVFVLGLRYKGLGSTDTVNYYNMMKKAIAAESWSKYYDDEGVEIGFQYFLFVLSRVFHNPQWIIFISSAIYISAVMVFCYRYSDNICLSITMYICLEMMTFNMQGMRQSIAMSICLFAYAFAQRRRLIPFALLVALACTVHQTAIVFIIVYFLPRLELKPSHIVLVCIGALLFVAFSQTLLNFANELFDKEYGNKVESGGYVATAIYALILIFSIIASEKPISKNMDNMMFYMLIVGFLCYIERYIGSRVAERVSYYFIYSQAILLPNAISNGRIRVKDKKFIEVIVVCLSVLLFMYRLSGGNLIPFSFFWEK